MKRVWMALAAAGLLAAAIAPAGAAGARALWRIGALDGSYREFALAGRYADWSRRFGEAPVYRLGRSRPGHDWPYIHPGPGDPWAGARRHPLTIAFTLASAPRAACRLTVALVDSRHDSVQSLAVDVNGRRSALVQLTSGASEDSLTDPTAGRQSTVSIPFAAGLLRAGENRIALTVDEGSWALYDSITLETGPGIPCGPVVADLAAALEPAGQGGPAHGVVRLRNAGARGAARAWLDDGAPVTVALEPGANAFALPSGAGAPSRVSVEVSGRRMSAAVEAHAIVWRIGALDGGFGDLAVAGNYPAFVGAFPGDVTFRVGRDDPARAWPFIHPGPNDAWAGERRRPFHIDFELERKPSGSARLVLDLVDTQPLGGPTLEVAVNGRARVRRELPAGGSDFSLTDPSRGKRRRIEIPIAAGLLQAGANRITLTVVSGSWLTYDSAALEVGAGLPDGPVIDGLAAVATPLFRRVGGRLLQAVRISLRNAGVQGRVLARVEGAGPAVAAEVDPGECSIDVLIPPIRRAGRVCAVVASGGHESRARFAASPERRWRVYIGASTHTDIGYTDLQERVYERHNANTAGALAACAALPGYRWNLEVGYQAELFRRRGSEARAALLARIRDGRVGLGALYLNMLTGLCSGEELVRAVTFVQQIAAEAGGRALAANLTDVPTAVGTLPMILAAAGVRYFADGANDVLPFAWGGRAVDQRPYWWEGLDGSRVLAITTHTYAQAGTLGFHDDVATVERRLPGWLRQTVRGGYPGEALYLYGAFSDNQPAGSRFAQVAAEWNARWEYPRVIVGRVDEFFRDVETHVGRNLPVVRGDMGALWEDGAASSAAELAQTRRARTRLEAAERWHALAGVLGGAPWPGDAIRSGWDQTLLFDEHTWGAAASVTDPEGEQTHGQWAVKAGFAARASALAGTLLTEGMAAFMRVATAAEIGAPASRGWVAANSLSWPRDIAVWIPTAGAPGAVRVVDGAGRPMASQAVGRGRYFVSRGTPAFGWRSYRLAPAVPNRPAPGLLRRDGDAFSWRTPRYRLRIDPGTGAVRSLRDAVTGGEWVRQTGGMGLNQLLYVLGGDGGKTADPRAPLPALRTLTHTEAHVSLEENGPLRAVLRIERRGGGAPAVDTSMILEARGDIRFVNVMHKEATLAKEAAYFAFPFAPGGPASAHMELPYGVLTVDDGQAPGACRAWYCADTFAAVSCARRTALLSSIDAPLFTVNDIFRGRLAPHTGPANGALFAYVLNNYWGTNYKASQGGHLVFSFALRLTRGAFDPAAATRFGRGAVEDAGDTAAGAQTATRCDAPAEGSALQVQGGRVIVGGMTRRGDRLEVRLYNPCGQAAAATIGMARPGIGEAWLADLAGRPLRQLPTRAGRVTARVPARGLTTLLIAPAEASVRAACPAAGRSRPSSGAYRRT